MFLALFQLCWYKSAKTDAEAASRRELRATGFLYKAEERAWLVPTDLLLAQLSARGLAHSLASVADITLEMVLRMLEEEVSVCGLKLLVYEAFSY